MDKKMRGIADPFTLGIIIALLGSVTAATVTDKNQQTGVQNVASQSSDTAIVAFNEESDE